MKRANAELAENQERVYADPRPAARSWSSADNKDRFTAL